MYGYGAPCQSGGGDGWLWIIIVVLIIFFILWGVDAGHRRNAYW